MTTHNIPLQSFVAHGKVHVNTAGGVLCLNTNTALDTNFHRNDRPIRHYAHIPQRFKIPFRIDITVQLDSPAFYFIIGDGHIGFATGLDNRPITDVLGMAKMRGENKPGSQVYFDNEIPLNEYVDISITYGSKSLWIMVNGALRGFSEKEPYIKALKKNTLSEVFDKGFNFALACDKRTKLSVKSLAITEFGDDEPTHEIKAFKRALDVFPNLREKPSLDLCIQGLSAELQQEVLCMDTYLMKDMKQHLKFKRKIEGGYPCCKITYVSQWGFRYKIFISNAYLWHDNAWIAYNTRRETDSFGGRKKADYTVETLHILAKESPAFADLMFERIQECSMCNQGGPCSNWEVYEYNEQKKVTCAWNNGMHFKMFPADFDDVKKVIRAISQLPKNTA